MTAQDRLLIALTRTCYPRTVDALACELRMPKPSVRRCVGELRNRGYVIDMQVETGEYFLLAKPGWLHARMRGPSIPTEVAPA